MEFIPSVNFARGRRPTKWANGDKMESITAIIIHYTGSVSIEGTIAWFKDPLAKVSAHYVIGRDGRDVQMVHDYDTAWHAGKSILEGVPNVNNFSIGIELVGTADSGFRPPQLHALYLLLDTLVTTYKIRPDRVVGHSTVAPGRKIDPEGYAQQFDWPAVKLVTLAAYNALPPTHNA